MGVSRRPARVVLATRNAHKVAELNRILADAGFAGQLAGLDEFPDAPDVPETGSTFADNALLKARAIAAHTGLPAVSDDSGLTVDALNGMPGILSARWAGKHGDDRANLELVLAPAQRRREPGRRVRLRGRARAARRHQGVDDHRRASRQPHPGAAGQRTASVTTRSSCPPAWRRRRRSCPRRTKDAISHRGRAFRGLAKYIVEV